MVGKSRRQSQSEVLGRWAYGPGRRLQPVLLGSQRPASGGLPGGGRGEGTKGIRRTLKRKVESEREFSSSLFAEIHLAHFCL